MSLDIDQPGCLLHIKLTHVNSARAKMDTAEVVC